MSRVPSKNYQEAVYFTHPELCNEVHPDDLFKAKIYVAGSSKKIRWICSVPECNYEWSTCIFTRAKRGGGCPVCNDLVAVERNCLETTHLEIASQLVEKQRYLSKEVTRRSSKQLMWNCNSCAHQWKAKVSDRVRGDGCPACRGLVATANNCLAATHVEIADQLAPGWESWGYKVTHGSHKVLKWKCYEGCGHEWECAVKTRTKGNNCPACRGYVVTESNCLQTVNPHLSNQLAKGWEEWAYNVTCGSRKVLLWRCPVNSCLHEWFCAVAERSRGYNCPSCSGKVVTNMNCLQTVNPELALELAEGWENMAAKVTSGSGKILKWKCKNKCGHEWLTSVSSRTRGSGCPSCAGTIVTEFNSIEARKPDLSFQVLPKNKHLLTKYTAGSSERLPWVCSEPKCRFEWKTTAYHRIVREQGCPRCNSSWTITTASSFLLQNQEKWTFSDEQTYAFLEQTGMLLSKGKARTLVELLIKNKQLPVDFMLFLQGDFAPYTESIISSHRSIDYGRKDTIPASLRAKVLKCKGDACLCCGSKKRICMDHKIPESHGGKTVFDNLQPLCNICNLIKGVRLVTISQLKILRNDYLIRKKISR